MEHILQSIPQSTPSAARITVVYDNEHTRRWAERAYKQALGLLGPNPAVGTWWSVGDLAQPGVLAGACSVAMRAKVVIVSISSGGGLPLPFYVWTDCWLANRRIAGGHLLVMIGTADETEYRLNQHVREYFRSVAREGGFCLSLEERRLPEGDLEGGNGARKPHRRPNNGKHCLEPALAP